MGVHTRAYAMTLRVEAREHLTGYGFLLPSRVSVRLGHECLDLLRYRNGSRHFFGFLR